MSVDILTGCPATVAPAGKTARGLPVGIQILGPYLEDATPIRLAGVLARENGGFTPPPGYGRAPPPNLGPHAGHRIPMFRALCLTAIAAAAAFAQTPPTVAKVFDSQLSSIEREFVSLAEAMPPEKYNFAPKDGEFANVRTFGQQVTHTAAVIYLVASAAMEEKNPSEPGPGENGPASLKTKDEIVKYLKDAFAYGHKAMNTLTASNLTDQVKSAFGNNKTSRVAMANVAVWHSFDHYGQAAVYARMNGVVPPASRR